MDLAKLKPKTSDTYPPTLIEYIGNFGTGKADDPLTRYQDLFDNHFNRAQSDCATRLFSQYKMVD